MSLARTARAPTPTTVPRVARGWLRPSTARSSRVGTRVELALASFGLFICTGLPERLVPSEFRLVKHAFYAWIMCLLLLRWRATLRVATRDLALCCFAILLVSSALWSELPVWAFKRGAVMLQTTAFGLYLASRFSLSQQLRALCFVLTLLLAALAASALLDPVGAFASPGHPGAFRGPLVHKNHEALLMALAIPALLIQIRDAPRQRALFGAALAAALVFLVLAQSLGGRLVAAMLGAVVAAHSLLRPPRAWLLLVPTLVVALGTAAAVGGLLDGVLVALGKDTTLTGRTEIWEQTLKMLAERPLLGHSTASFWQLRIVASTGVWFSNAHNGYLQLLIDLGLIGFVTFVLQLLVSLVRSLAFAQRPEPAALWPYCVTALVLVYNLVEVSVVEENSIVWVLYVSASFAVRSPGLRRPSLVDRPASLARSARAVRA